MPDILHRVGIKAAPGKVYEALSTIEGLRHWWISEAKGDPRRGGVIDFGFTHMKVVETRPNRRVKWKCVWGPKEWVNTEITFDLAAKPIDSQARSGHGKAHQTFVLFTHAKWKKPVEFMRHCSTKWAVFLFSLIYWLERGEGRPVPYDVKIHAGD